MAPSWEGWARKGMPRIAVMIFANKEAVGSIDDTVDHDAAANLNTRHA